MPTEKQLTVLLENVPGTLARLAEVLRKAKVNILALEVPFSGVEGWIQLVVDNPGKAKKAFDSADLPYKVGEVLLVELPNVPGALGDFAARLSAKGINIISAYQTAVRGAKKASVVFAVSDLKKAGRLR